VVLDNGAKPIQPSIFQQGQQQACADSSFQFSVQKAERFTAGTKKVQYAITTGATARIGESGNYFVKAQNIFGCISDNSTCFLADCQAENFEANYRSVRAFQHYSQHSRTGEVNESFCGEARIRKRYDRYASKSLKSGVILRKQKLFSQ
jgi:hypothetical protein